MNRRLGVNIDHVATVRQARRERYPDPVAAAIVAELAGADQITCHLRGDRRHIQDADLPRLLASLQTPLNVEMAPTTEMIDIAVDVLGGQGQRVTLVPEREGEITTEGGLDITNNRDLVERAIPRLREAKIHTSLFIDPEETQVRAAVESGVDAIELNTARYAELGGEHEIARLHGATGACQQLSKRVEIAAGHGLTHHNLGALVQAVPDIVEYNIGHSIVARAIFVGLDRAVRDLKEILR